MNDESVSPLRISVNERCSCTSASAWLWVEDVLEVALTGDQDYCRILPLAVEHAICRSGCPVVPAEMIPKVLAWIEHNDPAHHRDVCPFCRMEAAP